MLDRFVGSDDLVEGDRQADRYLQAAFREAGIDVTGGVLLGIGWDVITADESDDRVLEQQREVRDRRLRRRGEVGRDRAVHGQHVGVHLGIGGERDVDDAIDTVRGDTADAGGYILAASHP